MRRKWNPIIRRCEYYDRDCEMWDGCECLACFPEQCPENDESDVATIREWQLRCINEESPELGRREASPGDVDH